MPSWARSSSSTSLSYALSPMIRRGASSVGMKSNRPCTSLHSWGVADAVSTATGRPRASTSTMIFTSFPAFATPMPSPPPLALLNVAPMKHS
ncbi:MAG: hypothetical protein IT434_16190 [Phycisphaerales bacterium]|nr:hypothetical protein [Phycisphaerales bacterium]